MYHPEVSLDLTGITSRGLSSRAMAVAAPVEKSQQQHKFPQEAHGFVLEREQFVQEYDSNVALYKHKKTGKSLLAVALAILVNAVIAQRDLFWSQTDTAQLLILSFLQED